MKKIYLASAEIRYMEKNSYGKIIERKIAWDIGYFYDIMENIQSRAREMVSLELISSSINSNNVNPDLLLTISIKEIDNFVTMKVLFEKMVYSDFIEYCRDVLYKNNTH